MYGNPDSVCRRMRDVFTEVTGSCCERLRFRGATDHHYLLSGPPRLISLFFSCFFHPPPPRQFESTVRFTDGHHFLGACVLSAVGREAGLLEGHQRSLLDKPCRRCLNMRCATSFVPGM